MRAEPPETKPGTEIAFDALIADPLGDLRGWRRIWAICDPEDGRVSSCGDPQRSVVLGTAATATWTVPYDLLADLDDDAQRLGRDVYVVLAVEGEDDTGDHDVAFKRVRVSTNPDPNRNPAILAFAAPAEVVRGERNDLTVVAGAEARESWIDPHGGTKLEDARFSWLISAGRIDHAVTYGDERARTENRWTAPGEGDAATIWVVLRDGRGGVGWAAAEVSLR